MSEKKSTVLVVDDQNISRKMLNKMLSDDYSIIEAENGEEALAIVKEHGFSISAVLLDIVMPVMNGYDFLKEISKLDFKNIPIIAMTGDLHVGHEEQALEMGAWDFISKPYTPGILISRLKSAIARSKMASYEQLKKLVEIDTLTGIYNKNKFFQATRSMLDENPQTKFVLVRFDIDKFKLINSYFGKDTGDKVLIKIAKMLKMNAKNSNLPMTYGRMDADIFCVCATFNNNETVIEEVEKARGLFSSFFQNFEIVVSFGIYVINDPSVEIAAMYDNTILAVKTCKGNYIKSYAFYNDEMSAQIVKEQNIVNDMNAALEENQFVVYYQPKYDLRTNKPYGAEALVRWIHPEKGMIYPGEFIPIFERNGFICKLD